MGKKALRSLFYITGTAYGDTDANGMWRGMVADLKNGKADISIMDLSITPERSEVIDFASGIYAVKRFT